MCRRLRARRRWRPRPWHSRLPRRFEVEHWGYEPAGLNQFEVKDRTLPGRDPFDPPPKPARTEDEEGDRIWTFAPDEVPFCEVVEVELEGEAP